MQFEVKGESWPAVLNAQYCFQTYQRDVVVFRSQVIVSVATETQLRGFRPEGCLGKQNQGIHH